MAAREGDPRPVSIKRDVAIIQGGWSKHSHFRSDWVAEVKVVEDREFVALDKADHRLVHWLGNDTSMLSYLASLRSEKTSKMMQDLADDRNPLGGGAANASPGKRKDLAADLPPTLDIEPIVNGEPITMAILTSWSDKQRFLWSSRTQTWRRSWVTCPKIGTRGPRAPPPRSTSATRRK